MKRTNKAPPRTTLEVVFLRPKTGIFHLPITHTVTAGFMPRDTYHQPSYRQFPKQKPRLEVPRDRRS